MSSALKLPPRHVTIPEFLSWADDAPGRWQLRDGEPELMTPTTDAHGSIQSELSYLITAHLRARSSRCRVVTAPGVTPRVRADQNMLIPDIGITCAPPSRERPLPEPLVLIEILSPSNEAQTRANVWAFTTIPSVQNIIVVSSIQVSAEVLRRQADGSWPEQPEAVTSDGELRIDAIGFRAPLRNAYRTTPFGPG